MAMASSGADVRGMFDRIAHRYDHANRVMSAGIDVLWRRRAIARLLEGAPGDARFLDLGAGTLDGALAIAERSPAATVVAADFARKMLVAGLRKPGADRIHAQVADGHALPYRDRVFDGAFSAFCVRNLYDLPRALAELRRVVRPGGRVAILEFFRPGRRRWFWDGFYHPHVLPLLGWAITGDRAAYQYLPESIGRFRSLPEFLDLLRAAGFAEADGTPLFPSGIASLVIAR
jgi:demethylmenaquinone methyltransferase/2-methoxy-6-polyprenyl-1,4-benzoquinol methylase